MYHSRAVEYVLMDSQFSLDNLKIFMYFNLCRKMSRKFNIKSLNLQKTHKEF